ncbi:MAG: flagellar brake protein [Nitrospinota bacterium]
MFPVGSSVQIIGYLDKRKLSSRIIGWSEGIFVVIEHPLLQGELALLPKDAAVVCRGTVDGRTYAFKSHVLHVMIQPFNYLFLRYPRDIQEITARQGLWVDIKASAQIILSSQDAPAPPAGAKEVAGVVHNVSTGGCVISLPKETDLKGVACAFLTFGLPNGSKVNQLKGTVPADLPPDGEGGLELHFEEGDPNGSPLFEFLLLASKILSPSAGS